MLGKVSLALCSSEKHEFLFEALLHLTVELEGALDIGPIEQKTTLPISHLLEVPTLEKRERLAESVLYGLDALPNDPRWCPGSNAPEVADISKTSGPFSSLSHRTNVGCSMIRVTSCSRTRLSRSRA